MIGGLWEKDAAEPTGRAFKGAQGMTENWIEATADRVATEGPPRGKLSFLGAADADKTAPTPAMPHDWPRANRHSIRAELTTWRPLYHIAT